MIWGLTTQLVCLCRSSRTSHHKVLMFRKQLPRECVALPVTGSHSALYPLEGRDWPSQPVALVLVALNLPLSATPIPRLLRTAHAAAWPVERSGSRDRDSSHIFCNLQSSDCTPCNCSSAE